MAKGKVRVVLSAPLLIGEGTFKSEIIRPRQVSDWLSRGWLYNYCGHETVRLINLDPAEKRDDCTYYDEALILKPKKRLEFGREYTREEIADIGVDFILITRVG
jgi:hypothetical protein